MIGHDGSIYHYGYFDPRHDVLTSLTVFRLDSGRLEPGLADPCGHRGVSRRMDRRKRMDAGIHVGGAEVAYHLLASRSSMDSPSTSRPKIRMRT